MLRREKEQKRCQQERPQRNGEMGAGVTGTERREVGPWCQMQGVKHRQETVHAATTAKSLQSCPTLCDRIDGSPSGSLSLGFSRQEHWSGLPFPFPMHESEN